MMTPADVAEAERYETHQVVCAWCNHEYTEPGPPKNVEGDYVSHGICPSCSDAIRTELENIKLKRLSDPSAKPVIGRTNELSGAAAGGSGRGRSQRL